MFFRPRPAHDTRAASIAVAPADVGGLAADESRLVRTFIEDLIAELARFQEFEVLAAHTVFSLTPEQLRGATLTDELGLTHLLDSSVRRGAQGVTIKAQLVELATGRHLWAGSHALALRGLPQASEQVAAEVANQLSSKIRSTRHVQAQRQPVTELAAYDCWLRGREVLRAGTVEADLQARALFEQALIRDPTFARAWAGLSLSHFNDWSCQRWDQWEEGERLAYEYARRAEELDPNDAEVLSILGRIEVYRRQPARGRAHLERAVALAPNNADLLVQTAVYRSFLGDEDQALDQIERAFRLNPAHESWYLTYAFLPLFLARRLEDALRFGEAAPPHGVVDQSAFMAVTYARLGRMEDARREADAFRQIFRDKITFGREPGPDEPIAYLLHVNPFARPEDADYLAEGLRLAGLHGKWNGEPYLFDKGHEAGRFAKKGALWEVTYAGRTAHLEDMKGCRDLSLLLASPQARIHCMELAGRVAEGDAGEVMDAQARAACQRRIRQLQEDLAEAERHNDLARGERLAGELDALIERLAAALGLGGRGRKLGDPAEKARTAVTWRIRSALKKIADAHPELGRHLQVSVRTGSFCSYSPERPVRWAVG